MLSETMPEKEEPPAAESTDGEAPAVGGAPEPPSKEFVAAGEGTVSDGKGGSKKIFFLQQKKGERPGWLKTMSEGISSVGAAANTTMHSVGSAATDTVSRLVKPSSEKVEAEKMESEDKTPEAEDKVDRVKQIVDAGRTSLDAASTRITGLMASMKPAPKDAAAEAPAPAAEAAPSRLAALRVAMAHMAGKDDKADDVTDLKAQVAELKETVAALVDKVAKLEAAAEAS
mmetsp:Transcript_7042/g.18419  ORF Transcript_7042/g.18419 Transcript_7042/m.18419 type:complete len:229 (+) Transcript_7042:44-730(+)